MLSIRTTSKPRKPKYRKTKARKGKSKARFEGLVQKAKVLQEKIDKHDLPIHVNPVSEHTYRGQNVFILEISKAENGFKSNQWVGYGQAKKVGGHVRANSKGTPIFIYKNSDSGKEITETDGDEEKKSRTYFSVQYVFNLDQIEKEKE